MSPGNLEFLRLIEEELGVHWEAERNVFYCAAHTPLVVEHGISGFRAHEQFVASDSIPE
ncbi:MAG TPA: hypothetical protein VGC71_10245 [Gaiellales bacterium]|jgi:hypothetical protein